MRVTRVRSTSKRMSLRKPVLPNLSSPAGHSRLSWFLTGHQRHRSGLRRPALGIVWPVATATVLMPFARPASTSEIESPMTKISLRWYSLPIVPGIWLWHRRPLPYAAGGLPRIPLPRRNRPASLQFDKRRLAEVSCRQPLLYPGLRLQLPEQLSDSRIDNPTIPFRQGLGQMLKVPPFKFIKPSVTFRHSIDAITSSMIERSIRPPNPTPSKALSIPIHFREKPYSGPSVAAPGAQ